MVLKRWIKAVIIPAVFLGVPAWWVPGIYSDWRFWTLAVLGVILLGSQPDRAGRRENADWKGNADRSSLMLIYFGGYLQLAVAYGYYWSLGYHGTLPEVSSFSWVGAVGSVVGMGVRVVAIRTLGRWFTVKVVIQDDHELMTNGLYGWFRHPSYTGAILFWAAIPFLLNVWIVSLITWPVLAFVYYWRIRAEEKALRDHFGSAYEEYQEQTWRVFPGL